MTDLKELEELTFADADPEEVGLNIVTTVEGLLGRKLQRADPLRLFLMGVGLIIIQQRLLIDQSAKMNLLAYAEGAFLDHIGALVGTDRLPASTAVTTMELFLSAARSQSTVISKGTRATAGDGIYFALDEDAIIPAGEKSVTAEASCTQTGEAGNGYLPGEICKIVDPVPFLQSLTNTTKSEGGADVEEDDAYRERIHEAPERFSTAGSSGAYVYHAKAASALISDVGLDSPTPGEVVVYPLLKGGVLPGEEILALVYEKLSDRTVRPLTDKVSVVAPEVLQFDIDLIYYIARSRATSVTSIQKAADAAVQEYVAWQKEKLGRDVNPTELYYRLRAAGVKRVVIVEPAADIVTKENQVAIAGSVRTVFGGLEDD